VSTSEPVGDFLFSRGIPSAYPFIIMCNCWVCGEYFKQRVSAAARRLLTDLATRGDQVRLARLKCYTRCRKKNGQPEVATCSSHRSLLATRGRFVRFFFFFFALARLTLAKLPNRGSCPFVEFKPTCTNPSQPSLGSFPSLSRVDR
jgi:hypothetical protein